MENETKQEEQTTFQQDHPWISMQDNNIDETIRFSLDEIRMA